MSKFVDKLQRVYHGSASPIGFRKSAADAGSRALLLVANLTGASVKEAKALVAAGIDAGIASSKTADAIAFGRLATAVGDIPLGLSLETANRQEIERFVGSGCDFVVFGLKTPLEVVRKEEIGKILRVEPSLDQGLVRAIDKLPFPVDGVLVAGEESSVTVERLLICQRFAELVDRPLLVTLDSSASGGELSSLCEAGVNGLLLPEGFPAEALVELRKTVADLPRVPKRKAKRAALLPQLGGEPETEVEEEDIWPAGRSFGRATPATGHEQRVTCC